MSARPNPVALVVHNSETAHTVQKLFDPKVLRVVSIDQIVAGWRFDAIMVTRAAWEDIQDYPIHANTAKLAWWQDVMLTRLSGPNDGSRVIYL